MAIRRKAGTGLVVTGVEELDKKLTDLEPSLRKKALSKGTREVANAVLIEARARVPKKTGQLAKSLRVRARKKTTRWERQHLVGHEVATRDGFFAGDEFYGGFLEFGWAHLSPYGSPPTVTPVRARPFLRPALYSDRYGKLRLYFDVINDWIKGQKTTGAGRRHSKAAQKLAAFEKKLIE